LHPPTTKNDCNMKKILTTLAILGLLTITAVAQNNCVPIVPNSYTQTVNLPIGVNCTTLSLKVPHLKQSSDYLPQSIAYQPLPYTTATGTALNVLYVDDRFSAVINLPFYVCFYDSLFNRCVIGSNSIVTFDQANANCSNAWDLEGNIPIPYAGGTICSTSPEYYPRASIMGGYTDIDPSVTTGHPNRKIEYRIEGTAPCRKLVVSYNDIAMFNCNSLGATMQMVIQEGTGIIDVFIQNKDICPTWNNGNAILGMQNWARNKAVSQPGKNCTQWTANNQGFRFLPSGGSSRFIRSELIYNGAVIALADTSTSAPGELMIQFPNVCPPLPTARYVIKTIFANCGSNGPGQESENLTRFDTIDVNLTNSLQATATSSPTACNQNNGSITFAVPSFGTAPYNYSVNGGQTFQQNPLFTGLTAGNYNCVVTDAGQGISSFVVTVAASNNLSATSAQTNVLCNGANTGSITVTPSNGVAPYQYALNGGSFQNSNTFANLAAGNYTIQVKDNGNCTTNLQVTIAQPPPLTLSATTANATCSVNPDGQINATAGGGSPGYTYSINGTTFQAANQFLVSPGTYTVTVKDNNNCTRTTTATVGLTNSLTVQTRSDTTICRGVTVPLTTASTGNQFSWSPTAGLNNPNAASPLATPQTTTTYIVTAQLGSCSKKDTVTINVNPSPTVAAGPGVSILVGDDANLNAVATNANGFLWTPPTGVVTPTSLVTVARPTQTTLYTITVRNEFNCTATDTMRVTVIPFCIRVRNAFTPNGDGRNDLWLVTDTYDCLRNITANVFNRYGTKVYENRDYRNGWDGRYQGKTLPDGTYYYVIDFTLITGRVLTMKGDVTILR
jgi:gliding motility-associated-like protein